MNSRKLTSESVEDMSKPLVSVVITCKNNLDTLKETLESLRNQTFHDFEVIVIDAFSDDGTFEYLSAKKTEWDKLHVLRERGNPAKGRNSGILRARGDYIAFIDADAYAHPNWLETLVKAIKQYENDGISGVGGPGETPPVDPINAKVMGSVLSSPLVGLNTRNNARWKTARFVDHHPFFNAIYRRDIFEKVGLLNERLDVGEDVEFGWRVRKAGFKLLYIPNAIVYHHRRKSIASLAKQMYRYGYWRMILRLVDGSLISPIHFAPLGLLVIAILTIILSVMAPFFNFLTYVFMSLSLTYVLLMISLAINIAIKFRSPKAFLLAFTSASVTHICYGLGSLKGLFEKRI